MVDTVDFERILAVDINRSITNACLFAQVDGRFRLVARASAITTLDGDRGVIPGVLYAIQRLEHTALVHLLGIDRNTLSTNKPRTALLVSCNLAPPLRVLPVGLSPTFSIAGVTRACQLPFVEMENPVEFNIAQNKQVQMPVLSNPPDVIILSGGFEDTHPGILATAARSLVTEFSGLVRGLRPTVICAGNQSELRTLTQILTGSISFRSVRNISPAPNVERLDELQNELLGLYEQTKLTSIPGYNELAALSTYPPISTYRALESTVDYLADPIYSKRTLVEITQDSTGMCWANGSNKTFYGTRLGLNHNKASAEDIKRWLPLGSADLELIVDYIQSRVGSIPTPESALLAQFASAHQSLYESIRSLRSSSNLPALGNTDFLGYHNEQTIHPAENAQMLLTILDTVQPVGATRIELDGYYFWPHLGAIGLHYPRAAAEINMDKSLHTFGVCLAPYGAGSSKATVKLTITRADGSLERYVVPGGIIRQIGLPSHEVVEVAARCSSEFSFYNRSPSLRLVTPVGPLGLVIDTRGRPLPIESAGVFWRLRVGSDLQALTKA